jgi:hypothetical protein
MYQLLVKYAGSMKPFRLAAVCEKNSLCRDTSLYGQPIVQYQIAYMIFQVLSIITLATYPFIETYMVWSSKHSSA